MNVEIPGVVIRHEIKPGDLGAIIHLHGDLYWKEYGFDATFESYVATYLAEFVRLHSDQERIWIVEKENAIAGSIAIVRFNPEQAQLRWLLLHPDLRGQGLGSRLMKEAIFFSKNCGYSSIFLWTTSNLHGAERLYKDSGFVVTEENSHKIWGVQLTEQRYELRL